MLSPEADRILNTVVNSHILLWVRPPARTVERRSTLSRQYVGEFMKRTTNYGLVESHRGFVAVMNDLHNAGSHLRVIVIVGIASRSA
jgi:hypothetical protein